MRDLYGNVSGYRGPLGLMNPACRKPNPMGWAEESRTVGAGECGSLALEKAAVGVGECGPLALENAGRWRWRMRAVGVGERAQLALANAGVC